MRDVAAIVADEKINMSACSTVVHKDQTATVWCTLQVSGLDKLSRVLNRIEGLRDVYEVVREVGRTRARPTASPAPPRLAHPPPSARYSTANSTSATWESKSWPEANTSRLPM